LVITVYTPLVYRDFSLSELPVLVAVTAEAG